MKRLTLLLLLIPTLALSQIRIGPADRQKVVLLAVINDTLKLQIENDVVREVELPAAAGSTDDQTAAEVPFTPDGSIASTNVQDAIVEVRNEAGVVPPVVISVSDGYSLLDADKNYKTLRHNGTSDIEVTIPKQATTPIADGSIYTFMADSTGVIKFKPEDSAVIMDTIQTKIGFDPSWVQWQKESGNRWIRVGGEEYTIVPPAPSNLYAHQNWIHPEDELDDNAGIIESSNPGNVTTSVENTIVFNGSHSLKIQNTSGLTDTGLFEVDTDFPVVAGRTYRVSYAVYRPSGSSGNWNYDLNSADGWTSASAKSFNGGSLSVDQWHPVVQEAVASATGNAKLTWRGRSGTDNGDTIYVDELIVIDITP